MGNRERSEGLLRRELRTRSETRASNGAYCRTESSGDVCNYTWKQLSRAFGPAQIEIPYFFFVPRFFLFFRKLFRISARSGFVVSASEY